MKTDAEEILDFWFVELSGEGRWQADDTIDAAIRDRFLALWERARDGGCDSWTCGARSCLALVILLDQFPRNMFRGDARAFATDAKALAVAKGAIARRQDLKVAEAERPYFYMPLVHSEIVADQDKAVRMFLLNVEAGVYLKHARAHRWVVRRFGRFPFRNPALGRQASAEEQAFLDAGGYRAALAEVG